MPTFEVSVRKPEVNMPTLEVNGRKSEVNMPTLEVSVMILIYLLIPNGDTIRLEQNMNATISCLPIIWCLVKLYMMIAAFR
jgi:hypothetical protein